jgi:hypothetical protein
MPAKWKTGSKCNGRKVESKNGFEEHHGARGRSNKLRFTERCREGEPGQRRAERETALYSRDPGGLFQEARERSDEVSYGEMSSRCSIGLSVWELNGTNNPPQLPGFRFKEIDDRLSSK